MDSSFDPTQLGAVFGGRRPNFLIIMVDEQRYPVAYETAEIREWRRKI